MLTAGMIFAYRSQGTTEKVSVVEETTKKSESRSCAFDT